MNLTEQVAHTTTVVAGADLATKNRFIKISSGKAAYCVANEKAIGVLGMPVESGGNASVKIGHILLVEVGTGGVTEMTEVTSDANGKAVAIGTGKSNGLCLDTKAAGELARILV